MKRSLKKKLIRLYQDISFPNAFSDIRKFQKSLRELKGITVSYRQLLSLLRSDIFYQTSVIKASKHARRKVVADGANILVTCDIIYVNHDGKQNLIIFVLDIFSRILRARIIQNRKLTTIKNAFFRMYGQKLPFSVIIVDKETAFVHLKKYFNNKQVLLWLKRGRNKVNLQRKIFFDA